jgi:hypothetical protein
VIVLANDDPPTANRMAKKVRRLIDAFQNLPARGSAR